MPMKIAYEQSAAGEPWYVGVLSSMTRSIVLEQRLSRSGQFQEA